MVRSNEGLSRLKKAIIISTMITTATMGTYSLCNSYRIYNNKKEWREFSKGVDKTKPELRNLEKKIKFEQKVKKIIQKNREVIKQEEKEKEKREKEKKQKLNKLSKLSGHNVVEFTEYTFEISFYSDLNCENGWGNITAYGETLSDGMIANNFLPKGTLVYFDGIGTKRVADTGSDKYFNAINKADVFVPRNYGESDNQYYKRVNNMGRKYVTGYILKTGGENEKN